MFGLSTFPLIFIKDLYISQVRLKIQTMTRVLVEEFELDHFAVTVKHVRNCTTETFPLL